MPTDYMLFLCFKITFSIYYLFTVRVPVCVHVRVHVCVSVPPCLLVCVQVLGQPAQSVLALRYIGLGGQSQVFRLNPQSPLISPNY